MWTEELQKHCKEEMTLKQQERIKMYRREEDRHFTEDETFAERAVDMARQSYAMFFCSVPSVFLCCFISVCLGFPLCVVFFVFFCSSFPGNSPSSPSASPPPWFLTLWKAREPQNGQNSTWSKTGHLEKCPIHNPLGSNCAASRRLRENTEPTS